MCILICNNILPNPSQSESGFQQLVAPGREYSGMARRGAARRAGKKFAVPGGNEAMTNEISRWREAGAALRRKGGALNGI